MLIIDQSFKIAKEHRLKKEIEAKKKNLGEVKKD